GTTGNVPDKGSDNDAKSNPGTTPLGRGHFSRIYRARGRHPANYRSAKARLAEFTEESRGRTGRSFRGRTRPRVNAHSACHAFPVFRAAAIRARTALALSAGSPLVGA